MLPVQCNSATRGQRDDALEHDRQALTPTCGYCTPYSSRAANTRSDFHCTTAAVKASEASTHLVGGMAVRRAVDQGQ